MPASRRSTDTIASIGPITDELARERASNAQEDADTAKTLAHDLDKRVHGVETAVKGVTESVDRAHTAVKGVTESVDRAHEAVKGVSTKVDGLHTTLEEIKRKMNGPTLFSAIIGLLSKPKDLVAVLAGVSTILGVVISVGWNARGYSEPPPKPQLVPVVITIPAKPAGQELNLTAPVASPAPAVIVP